MRIPDPQDGPAAPAMVEARKMTSSKIRVVWQYGADPAAGFVIYRRTGTGIFLTDVNGSGEASTVFTFGPSTGGWQPISGDWDGDGDDTVGIYDPLTGTIFLKNTNGYGAADIAFAFGPANPNPELQWKPITGDWNGDGVDTIGLYDPATGNFYLKNTNGYGAADI
ncbi:MAG: hypothetical protein IT175_08070, partial [Acidobacteria bacterium]|nr:hypothetical protein [Acidobacteriota bacterium]